MTQLATVTSAAPLQVRVDGATTATDALTLVAGLVVADRVAVTTVGRRLLILGRLQ